MVLLRTLQGEKAGYEKAADLETSSYFGKLVVLVFLETNLTFNL